MLRYILKKKGVDLRKNNKLKKDLLKPTKIYVNEILKLNEKGLINGCANITGGGLVDNLKRIKALRVKNFSRYNGLGGSRLQAPDK